MFSAWFLFASSSEHEHIAKPSKAISVQISLILMMEACIFRPFYNMNLSMAYVDLQSLYFDLKSKHFIHPLNTFDFEKFGLSWIFSKT